MPANDSIAHRGASAIRPGHRYAPYHTSNAPLKTHATYPLIPARILTSIVSSPEDRFSDCATDISSTATLVEQSFETDSDLPPTPLFTKVSVQTGDKGILTQRQTLHQCKVDYVACLIDFACQMLNEVWPTTAIPPVFRYQHGARFGYTPETQGLDMDQFQPRNCTSDLLSLRKFISELLRRSRSTCSTFQTALCYIEALRPKVPQYQQDYEDGRTSCIDGHNVIELEFDDSCKNVSSHKSKENNLPPLPALPSPLLCPRRTFMSALVLSAKFVQDKTYSNRAWAKLCGLPAREVSRSERAVGHALGWRLWVGKDNAFPFADIESKIGRPPTLLAHCPAVDELCQEKTPVVQTLGRAHTWPSMELHEVPCTSFSETEYSASPTPSLTNSSASSFCSSSTFTPGYPSPSSSFVSSDPCSNCPTLEITKTLVISDFLKDSTPWHSYANLFSGQQEQDVFGIRVVDGITVA